MDLGAGPTSRTAGRLVWLVDLFAGGSAETLRFRIGVLLAESYRELGVTLAAEKLLERKGINVSAETVRRLQIDLESTAREAGAGEACIPVARPAPAASRHDPDR